MRQKTEQRQDEGTSGSKDYDSAGPSHQTYRVERCQISGKRKQWPSDANAACIRLDQTDSHDSKLVTDTTALISEVVSQLRRYSLVLDQVKSNKHESLS